MFAAPLRRWLSIPLFLALVAGFVGVAVPAGAAVTRSVSVAASPTVLGSGQTTVLTGKVSSTPAGAPVQVQRWSGSRWVVVKSGLTTGTAGAFRVATVVPKVRKTYSYRVVAPARGTLAAATSRTVRVLVLRPVKATVRASSSSVLSGRTLTLRGSVSPFVRGAGVIVQRRVGTGAWTKYTTARLTRTGSWSKTVKPTSTASYRAYSPRHGQLAPAYSGATTVKVVPPPRITTTALPSAAQQFPYSVQLQKTGGNGIWSVYSGFLPFGMDLNASTGVISGTPLSDEPNAFTVRFLEKSTGRTAFRALSIKVVASLPPTITTGSTLAQATKAQAYGAQLNASNAQGAAQGTWAVTSGSLPSGVALAANGAISGSPALGGSYSFTVRFTENGSGLTATKAFTLAVFAPNPVITTTALPEGTQGRAYPTTTLQKSGGAGTWSIASGSLPSGVTLSAAGVLSGTVSAAAEAKTYNVTVRFAESDADAKSATQALALKINLEGAPVVTNPSLPGGKVDQAYTATLTQTNDGNDAGTWSISSGALPNGIVLNPNTGALSGAPTQAGDFSFTVTFTESKPQGQSGSKPLSIHVDPKDPVAPVITTTSLTDATRGEGYNAQLQKTGGAGTWARTGGSFPAGVTINASTGVINGTPTEAGDFTFTITFTETSSGLTGSKQLTLHVNPGTPPVITTTTLPDAQQYAPYKTTLAVTPSKPGALGTWSSTGLPSGFSLNPVTGELSGTTNIATDIVFTATYTEQASTLADSKQLTVHVLPATKPTVTTTSLPIGVLGANYSATLAKTAGTPAGQPGTWTKSGDWPTWATLNASTGAITGKPGVNGDWFFTVTYTETTSGLADSKDLTIHVSASSAPQITTNAVPDGQVGTSYSVQLAASGSGQSWSMGSGTSMPPGLTLTAGGMITGTPTTPGDYQFQVKVTVLIPLLMNDTRYYKLHVGAGG